MILQFICKIREGSFFFIDKKQIYYKAKKTNKRTPSTKVPKHTQEVYIEEPKRLEDKTKDKTAIRRTGVPKKRTKQKILPSPQPSHKIYQRVRLFDAVSICQCPQSTQEEAFCPLIRCNLIFKNQQVPIVPNSPEQANKCSHPNVFAFFTHRSPLPRKEHIKIREGSKVSCLRLTCSALFSNKNDELQAESGTQVFWTDKLVRLGLRSKLAA